MVAKGCSLGFWKLGESSRKLCNDSDLKITKSLCFGGGILVQVKHHERGSHRSGDFTH